MKNIEKQLIKSAKQLPSMQKEIVFSKKENKIHNRKSFCAVAIAALSLMICFGVTLSINADYMEEVIKFITKPEPISSEAPPPVINKTISVPIIVSFEGNTSQTKNVGTDTYEVIEGDTVILDVVVNVNTEADIGNIMSTINFDSTKLSFVSCSNNTYKQESAGKILVEYYGGSTQEQGTAFKIELKAISSGSISFNSEINCTIIVAIDHKEFVKEMDERAMIEMQEYNERYGNYGSIGDVFGNYNSGNGNYDSGGRSWKSNDSIVLFP